MTQAIREMVTALDQRKDEAIHRTFTGVAERFREVFKELVPGGHAEMVMLRKGEEVRTCVYLCVCVCSVLCVSVSVCAPEELGDGSTPRRPPHEGCAWASAARWGLVHA